MDVTVAFLMIFAAPAEPSREAAVPEDPAVTDVSAAEALETPTQPATDPLPTEQSPESDPVAEPAASAPDPTPESAPLQSEASPPTPIAEPAFVDFPAGTDDELAPIAERSAEEIVVDYQRRGGFVSLSGGVGHCGAECSYLPAIGGARFEGGYRWGHLAIGASVSIAGAKFSTAESEEGDFYRTSEADGRIQFFQMSPFAQLFFASSGRFDPYVQAGFGYHHFLRQSEISQGPGSFRWKYWSPSPGATLGAGAPVFVTSRVTIGLRFDKHISFAGKTCATEDGDPREDRSTCETWQKTTQDLNTTDNRYFRLSRPRPWTVAFEARFLF